MEYCLQAAAVRKKRRVENAMVLNGDERNPPPPESKGVPTVGYNHVRLTRRPDSSQHEGRRLPEAAIPRCDRPVPPLLEGPLQESSKGVGSTATPKVRQPDLHRGSAPGRRLSEAQDHRTFRANLVREHTNSPQPAAMSQFMGTLLPPTRRLPAPA